jgi:hypothetical protein
MSNIKTALKSMGYRQPDLAKNERWCKPLGYTMLTCDIEGDKFILCQMILAYPSEPKLIVWVISEKEIRAGKTLDNYIHEICYFESWELKDCCAPVRQHFAFLTKMEHLESFV